MKDKPVLVGYNGKISDGGVFYCPYVPLSMSQLDIDDINSPIMTPMRPGDDVITIDVYVTPTRPVEFITTITNWLDATDRDSISAPILSPMLETE